MKVGLQKLSLAAMTGLYILAGINHFWHPNFYINLIPTYLPKPALLNILSGVIEILLGVLLIFKITRKLACYGIVAMLIAFIPAHVYSIQTAKCSGAAICLPFIIVWVRLFVIHPFLVAWPIIIQRRM